MSPEIHVDLTCSVGGHVTPPGRSRAILQPLPRQQSSSLLIARRAAERENLLVFAGGVKNSPSLRCISLIIQPDDN